MLKNLRLVALVIDYLARLCVENHLACPAVFEVVIDLSFNSLYLKLGLK